MVLENDLESLDNGLEDINEDLFRDDYLLDEDASGSGLQSAWTRMKYWFYRNKLKWTNNGIVINEGKDNRSNANLRRGIPLYELDANGQPIDTGFEDEFALGTGSFSKVPWKLILRVLFGLLVFTVFLILVINITKSNRTIKVLSHFGNPDFDPYVKYFNGTHEFFPLTIVISLDGFHPSLISKRNTPFLHSLYTLDYDTGMNITSTPFMIPSFPTETFPNHWTLVTGQYPIHHGIVSNVFWDSDLSEEFHPGVLDPRIWNSNVSEPIWQTVQTAFDSDMSFKAATHMWPGSDVNYTKYNEKKLLPEHKKPIAIERTPYYFDEFNAKESLPKKLSNIMKYVDMDALDERPQLILGYVPNVDAFGHKHGFPAESDYYYEEFTKTLSEVDTFLQGLVESLRERNITDFTNLVIVSDHGMSNIMVPSNVVVWEDILNEKLRKDYVSHAYLEGPMMAISLKDSTEINEVYHELKSSIDEEKYKVYVNGNFPEEWNFNDRRNHHMASIWIVPEPGYAVMKKAQLKKAGKDDHKDKNEEQVFTIGSHGYNNSAVDMRSIFIGMGPYFPQGYIEPFQNTEIYDLLCDICGVAEKDRNSNDGSGVVMQQLREPENSDEVEITDDFEYLSSVFGKASTYNIIWGGYPDEEEHEAQEDDEDNGDAEDNDNDNDNDDDDDDDAKEIAAVSTSSLTTTLPMTTSTPSTTSTLLSGTLPSSRGSSIRASATTSAAGNLFQEIISDAKELIDDIIDGIDDLIDSNT
ncbi:nucleotide diphosphatase/phosphodiesterase NPP1 [Saccharomyces eubayanus]|uniref:nucleotide diphosphatase/phosphodiesterase NPP1 n=1 Tax=Saccharomyces eubayanus TaxID=1080349 RepID=UPI0006C6784C|nr:NPP1-like protein [Saccharomyces eubayanus]KOH00685.1 NPP1-like protein [Saccharomyces eubayanus]